eukprot:453168_1
MADMSFVEEGLRLLRSLPGYVPIKRRRLKEFDTKSIMTIFGYFRSQLNQEHTPDVVIALCLNYYYECIVRGVVKMWKVGKGYGFIKPNDGSRDVFVHYSEIMKSPSSGKRSLKVGESVEFEIVVQNDGRRKAIRVTGPNGQCVVGNPAPVETWQLFSFNKYKTYG